MEIAVNGTLMDFFIGYGAYILCFGLVIAGIIPAVAAVGGAMNLVQSNHTGSPKDKRGDWLFLCLGTIMAFGLWAVALFIAKWAFLELG